MTSAQGPGELSGAPTEILGDAEGSTSDELFLGPSRLERRKGGKEDKGGFWRELPVLIIMALVLALLIKTFLVQAFFIPSESMVQTLEPGDRVLVNKVIYRLRDPGRGDLIVFEDPHPEPHEDRGVVAGFFGWISRGMGLSQAQDEDFIKRIIGLPGETIQGRDGSVDVAELLGEGQARARGDRPHLDQPVVPAIGLDGPVAGAQRPGVDAEDDHAGRQGLEA